MNFYKVDALGDERVRRVVQTRYHFPATSILRFSFGNTTIPKPSLISVTIE